jgi:hypothetical protein
LFAYLSIIVLLSAVLLLCRYTPLGNLIFQ